MRKFMTAALALILVLSLAMPAFAETIRLGGIDYEGEYFNFETVDGNKKEIPVYYNVSVDETSEPNWDNRDNNKVYRAAVCWEVTEGKLVKGKAYRWNTEDCRYDVVTSGVQENVDASVTINVVNFSNANIDFSIAYESEGDPVYSKAYKRSNGDLFTEASGSVTAASASVHNAGSAVGAPMSIQNKCDIKLTDEGVEALGTGHQKVGTFTVTVFKQA